MRAPRAFSIIELLTALVLLTVGLAAFVRAAGAVARLESDARLRHVVAGVLRSRLDTVAGLPCGLGQSGIARQRGVLERWHTVADGRSLRLVDTIDVVPRPTLSRAVSTAVACRP